MEKTEMETRNGTDYAQNYDVIVKWMADALRGETLDVIGVKTGRIEEVFAFEPTDIQVRAGRVDVMARDETGALYHIEEQRNLRKADMYRFAAYHFLAARQWGQNLTDIILASGKVWKGEKGVRTVTTRSGEYAPLVIDFSQWDGRKRLSEIRDAACSETFDNWLELVFLPLWGKETDAARSKMAEDVLRFESEMYHAGRLSVRVLAATLILSNKLIDKERLKALWEEIKMLDILEIAREEGLREGEILGMEKGEILGMEKGTQEMIIEALLQRFDLIPLCVSEQVRAVRNQDLLRGLFRQALRCETPHEFEAALARIAVTTGMADTTRLEDEKRPGMYFHTERGNEDGTS